MFIFIWRLIYRSRRGCLNSLIPEQARGQAFNANGELIEQLVLMPNHSRYAAGSWIMTKDILILLMLDPMWWILRTMTEGPADPKPAEIWRKQVAKTKDDVINPSPGAGRTFVCSKLFPLGRRTTENPKMVYSIICFHDCLWLLPPKIVAQGTANKLHQANSSRCLLPNVKEPGGEDDGNSDTD